MGIRYLRSSPRFLHSCTLIFNPEKNHIILFQITSDFDNKAPHIIVLEMPDHWMAFVWLVLGIR